MPTKRELRGCLDRDEKDVFAVNAKALFPGSGGKACMPLKDLVFLKNGVVFEKTSSCKSYAIIY
jgi:hypothetical protein